MEAIVYILMGYILTANYHITLKTTALLAIFFICNFAWSPLPCPALLLISYKTSSVGVKLRRFRVGALVLPVLKLVFSDGGGVIV